MRDTTCNPVVVNYGRPFEPPLYQTSSHKTVGLFKSESGASTGEIKRIISMLEPEITICRICGEDFTDACPEHGTREAQEILAENAIEEQEQSRIQKLLFQSQEDSRIMFCKLWWYVHGGKP